jgi:uncharacterized protein (TIGR00661 family)
LPVEEYDIVLNDFESITSLSCRLKGIPSVNFGHQASFYSPNTPMSPKWDFFGKLILKKYATATKYVGLHFKEYDSFIFNPIIKKEILNANPFDDGHIAVYLSHYSDEVVAAQLKKLKGIRFEVFSKKAKVPSTDGNITYIPIGGKAFNESMIRCHGMITGAGFETPAEALFMGKKLLCIPIKGQYEQLCNAEAIKQFNVPIINKIDDNFGNSVTSWLNGPRPKMLTLVHSTRDIVEYAVSVGKGLHPDKNNHKQVMDVEGCAA